MEGLGETLAAIDDVAVKDDEMDTDAATLGVIDKVAVVEAVIL